MGENKREHETQEDQDLQRWMGRIEGKIDSIQETQKRHEAMFTTLPCVKHAEVLAGLKVISGFWGLIGGVLAMVGTWLVKKL